MFILNRYYKFYKYNGLIKTITKILTTPYRIVKKHIYQKNKKNIFNQNTSEKSLIKALQKKDLILFIKLISGPQEKVYQVMDLS